MFRPDAWVMGRLATAQWIAIGCIAVSVVTLIVRHRNWSWRTHPADAMTYMQGKQPAELTETPAAT